MDPCQKNSHQGVKWPDEKAKIYLFTVPFKERGNPINSREYKRLLKTYAPKGPFF
jgi:hypothetical protein